MYGYRNDSCWIKVHCSTAVGGHQGAHVQTLDNSFLTDWGTASKNNEMLFKGTLNSV